MKLLAITLVMACAVHAQDGYMTVYETSSATSEKITIQQPASPSKTIKMAGVSVYCSVECTVSIERDGTAASGTAISSYPAKINPSAAAATALAYRSSNVGSGTVLSKTVIGAGGTLAFDLDKLDLRRTANSNLTVVITSSSSGNYKTNIKHLED